MGRLLIFLKCVAQDRLVTSILVLTENPILSTKVSFKRRKEETFFFVWKKLVQSKTGLLGHSVYPTENVSKDLLFTYQDLKSCKPHEKTKQKHQKARSIDEEFDVLCFIFFHLISKVYIIMWTVFGPSFLYRVDFSRKKFKPIDGWDKVRFSREISETYSVKVPITIESN